MTPAPLHVAGERLMLDPAGLLAWPARKTLVVGDLHLEKGSHFAQGGRMVPPYDTRETLQKLQLALRRWRPARLIALGDSFHDAAGSGRMAAEDAALLHRLLAGIEMVWVLGNHDPVPPTGLPGAAVEELQDGKLVFRHEARRGPVKPTEISGHFHPKATMPTRCGGVTRPCFIADAWRVMLPAFGAYTGGLDAGDPAIAGLFPRGARVFLLGSDRCYSMPVAPSRAKRPPTDSEAAGAAAG
jgi:uncharacterized protein